MFLDVFTMILKNSESIVFYKEMVPECKPEWNREAIMVFSRLPSLMAADKPCPQLKFIYSE